MTYMNINLGNATIEVGNVTFSPGMMRTRASTEAQHLFMANAFDLGYRRYEWKCDHLNARSRVTAERLGFAYEGIFRQHMVYKGRTRDTAWYSVTDKEWPELDRAFKAWLDPSNFDQHGQQRRGLQDIRTRGEAIAATPGGAASKH